jgi:hypothetical protein
MRRAAVMNRRARLFVTAAAALGLGAPAAAEVTRATDDGFVSRHEIVVEASPKDVWLALIAPAGWWRKDHTWSGDAANLVLTPQAGGRGRAETLYAGGQCRAHAGDPSLS